MSDYQFAELESPVVRRLKLLIALLLLSNIALGGFGFYFLHMIDRKYTELIDRTLPALTDLRGLAAGTSQAMRKTNPNLFAQSQANRSQLLEQARLALQGDRRLRDRLLHHNSLVGLREEQLAIRAAGEAFDKAGTEVVDLIQANRIAEAERERDQTLRGLYDHYLETTTDAADRVEMSSQKASDNLSMRTSHLSKVMLGLGGWPLLIPVVLLITTLVFVILLALNVYTFKRKPISV